MRIAWIEATEERVLPMRRTDAVCPGCLAPVVARLGVTVSHHWAHRAGTGCDASYEPMTAWHEGWQSLAPVERQEVWLDGRRADMTTRAGRVVEVQHSSITVAEVFERTAHYQSVTGLGPWWVVDANAVLRSECKYSRTWEYDGRTWQCLTWRRMASWVWQLSYSGVRVLLHDADGKRCYVVREAKRNVRKRDAFGMPKSYSYTLPCEPLSEAEAQGKVRAWCADATDQAAA